MEAEALRPLRVLMVVEASFAGVGRHVLDLVVALLDDGHDVDIAYGVARAEHSFLARLADLPVSRAIELRGRSGAVTDVRSIRAVRRAVRDAEIDGRPYDIVHGHASRGGAYTRLIGRGSARTVYTPNAFITQSPSLSSAARAAYASIERGLSRRTDLLVCVSSAERTHADVLRLRAGTAAMIPNGIPLVDLPTRASAREQLGLSPDVPVVGFVGRLEAQKRVELLIDAFAELRERVPHARLALVGTGSEDRRLRDRARERGVADHVAWLGHRPGQRSMPAFDVLALPSHYEGFPYVALEALWAGVPVVTTPTSGCGDLLRDPPVGRVAEAAPSPFAVALAEMLDPRDALSRAAHARQRAGEHSVEQMTRRTLLAYRTVCGAAALLTAGSRR